MSGQTLLMMTFVSADGGWVAEYDQGATWYSGGSNIGRQFVAHNNSGNVNLIGSNYNNSNDQDYRTYMLEVDLGNATVKSSSRWTGQNNNASNTQNVKMAMAQYNYQQGKWYCNVGNQDWYELDGTTAVNGGAMLVLDDNGATHDELTSSTPIPGADMYYKVLTDNNDYGWLLMTGGDTVRYFYDVDTSYSPTRILQAYEAQSSGGTWSNTRGLTAAPNMGQFAIYNSVSNGEFSVSFHNRGTGNLSYIARKVPGNDSGSGYDTNNFDNVNSMDNSYYCYPITYNNGQSRVAFIRINNASTYVSCRLTRYSYNNFNARLNSGLNLQVPEASGSYVYALSSLLYYNNSNVYVNAGVLFKLQKSDMTIVGATAFIRNPTNPPGNNDNTFAGGPYTGFNLTQDEKFVLIGGTTRNSQSYGNDPLYIIKHPADFTKMIYGTQGNFYFWDFNASSTGGTYPTKNEVLGISSSSQSTYNRSLSISNQAGTYYEDNGQRYNTRLTNDPFTVTKTDIT